MPEKFSVTIIWGSEAVRDEADTASTYRFDTEGELNAFLDGVDEAVGWLDYEIVGDDDEDH